MRSALFALTVAALGFGGCSAATTTGGPAGSRDVISLEEIQATNVRTAYEVIRQLRPAFLTSRGTASLRSNAADAGRTEPVVYVDGVRFGDLDALRAINRGDLFEIRHLSATDATTRFGTGHVGGAILVTTRHGG